MSEESILNEEMVEHGEVRVGNRIRHSRASLAIPDEGKTFFFKKGMERSFKYEFAHLRKITRIENKNYLMPDYTIAIPKSIADKLNWRIGTEVVVNVLDESNSEAVISKKFYGEEAKKKFRALREGLYDNSDE